MADPRPPGDVTTSATSDERPGETRHAWRLEWPQDGWRRDSALQHLREMREQAHHAVVLAEVGNGDLPHPLRLRADALDWALDQLAAPAARSAPQYEPVSGYRWAALASAAAYEAINGQRAFAQWLLAEMAAIEKKHPLEAARSAPAPPTTLAYLADLLERVHGAILNLCGDSEDCEYCGEHDEPCPLHGPASNALVEFCYGEPLSEKNTDVPAPDTSPHAALLRQLLAPVPSSSEGQP